MQRAIIYARTSDQDKTDRLPDQIELGRGHCTRKQYIIVKELAETERGASGTDINLPQLEQIRGMAREGQFDVLVVRDVDRLSRSLVKQLVIEEELRHNGVRVEYVLADFADTPEGKLQKNIRATIAEFERVKIQERTSRGIRAALKRGSPMSAGKAPYGYLLERLDNGDHRFVIEPKEAQIVRLIYHWFVLDKVPAYQIAQRLTERKVLTWSAHPARPSIRGRVMPPYHWGVSMVLRILKNQTYTGVWTFARGTADPVRVPVPQIIDEHTFELAQAQRSHNQKRSSGRAVEALMARRLRCGGCGYKVHTQKRNRQRGHDYYVCPTKHHRDYPSVCTLLRVRTSTVDEVVWGWIEYLLTHATQVLDQAAEIYQAPPDRLTYRLEAVAQLIQEQTEAWENLVETVKAVEGRAKTVIGADIQALEDTMSRLEEEHRELQLKLAHYESTAANLRMLGQSLDQWEIDVAGLRQTYRGRRRVVEMLDMVGTLYKPDDQVGYIELTHNLVSLNPLLRLPLDATVDDFVSTISPDCVNEQLTVRLPLTVEEPGCTYVIIPMPEMWAKNGGH